LLELNFEEEFITKYSNKQIDDIKELYKNLIQSGVKGEDIKIEMESKIQELVN